MAMAMCTKRVFERGDCVEVCSKEKGFLGSYYAATIIANMGSNYVVEYKNLFEYEDDENIHLRETVMANDVRPLSPNQNLPSKPLDVPNQRKKFHKGDLVDVFANDGWWVGVITGKSKSCYSVFFETTWVGESTYDHIAYPVAEVRSHLEWSHGKWFKCMDRKQLLRQNPQFLLEAKRTLRDAERDLEKKTRRRRKSRMQEDDEKKPRDNDAACGPVVPPGYVSHDNFSAIFDN